MDLLLLILVAEVITLYAGLAVSEYLRRADLPLLKRTAHRPRPRLKADVQLLTAYNVAKLRAGATRKP